MNGYEIILTSSSTFYLITSRLTIDTVPTSMPAWLKSIKRCIIHRESCYDSPRFRIIMSSLHVCFVGQF